MYNIHIMLKMTEKIITGFINKIFTVNNIFSYVRGS